MRTKKPDSTFNNTTYKNAYNKEHYARINLILAPALRDELKQAATAAGVSVNAYIAEAIRDKLNKDKKGNRRRKESIRA
jgi:hypothetical protein